MRTQEAPFDIDREEHMMMLPYTWSPPSPEGVIMPTLYVSRAAAARLLMYVLNAPGTEINGFGYVKHHRGNYYVIDPTDIFITKQKVTAVSAEGDGVAAAMAVKRAAEAGRIEELRLQWHSHPGDVYFSPTDMNSIETFGQCTYPYLVSLVLNRQGEIAGRYDQFQPVRIGGPMQVIQYDDDVDDDVEAIQAEIANLVTVQPRNTKRARFQEGESA